MTTPWSPAQIAAAAPDPSSVTAARGLASKWTETGRSEHALWGVCRGSGSSNYLASVDLAGPAYRCSCPSRKFPCKHALGLLMQWSEGTVPAATAPDTVTTWLNSRAEKSSKATTSEEPSPKEPDPATVRRRVERAAAGLDDLDRWLTDRIRNGLGAVDHGYATYDEIAGRMVDAQIPGVAGSLRALPSVVATREDWPARVLGEYARLHLLIRAFRALPDLPEPLVRSVHTHLGFSTRADEVRRAPAVRDRWQAVASRTTEDNRVYTRKLWLRGRESGRWAIVLDFSHGTTRFDAEAPVPGTLVDADLHFYPGAAPLRAVIGARHGAPEPFTTLPATDFDRALGDYATALGTDPWIRAWPVLLGAVTPTVVEDRWFLVDRAERALPLAGDLDSRWRLLAVSGGHPVTVCGDWDGREISPASVFEPGQEAVAL
ncbi:SWIM zinc finger family protein [Rhodococcus phenolicus]|uniref:SWIM zinc finger family protein n=1 Tax=Rhodococcus phenolicus TaxID=263849 RepID=UPI00082DA1E8|nr:SWIM zinc finger family protein [Rhodococcus phenolicus]